MSHLALSEPEQERSSVRQLKIIVILLAISNIGLGAFSFSCLRAVDRRYSDLIDQTVPTLNELQALTAISVEAMRGTNPALLGGSAQNRTEALANVRAALERDQEMRSRILARNWFSSDANERLNFEEAGQAFRKNAEGLIALIESGQFDEAGKLREASVRPAFERYVKATTKAADLFRQESLRTSDVFTEKTITISKMILGLGSWPVMIVGLFLSITVAFIITVVVGVFVFRRTAA
jgi:hypothetical protein